MAIIKVIAKSGRSLKSAIDYVAKKAEIASGLDCADDRNKAIKQMEATKSIWGKEDGKQYQHCIQSFRPGEIPPAKAHEIGREWAGANFPDHEIYIATHTDRGHVHNHYIINSVSFETGRKLHLYKKDLNRLKNYSDKICLREGLSIEKRGREKNQSLGQIRTYNMAKYQLLSRINNGEHVKSYVLDAAIAADQALHHSSSREEFIKNMEKQGYKVNWQEQRKNITLIDPSGKKVRMSNLEKTFSNPKFSKEGMEFEFQRSKENRGRERQAITAKHSNPRGTSVERECSTERPGQISARSLEASRNYSIDQSISNIKRELQQLQARAGHGNQIAPRKNQLLNRKQLNLRERDQERD